MHILFVCNEYPPCNHGGIGSFTKDLAEGLVAKGFSVSVVGIYNSDVFRLSLPSQEIISGVNVYRYPEKKVSGFPRFKALLNRIYLLKVIRKLHCDKTVDVIECPDSQGWLALGAPKGISLITRLHGGEAYFGHELQRPFSRLNGMLEKWQFKKSNRLVSVSHYTAKKTLKIFNLEKDYEVIYNSVRVPRSFLNLDENSFVRGRIVFTGSLIPKKGVQELILAMNTVLKLYPHAELHLAGKNNLILGNERYQDFLSGLLSDELLQRVKFLGPLDREKELFPLLSSAEVCCYPSYSEAFALAPLEAMAMGKAVVFTKLSSGPEAIVHGESGLLCDPKNPSDIAKNIIKLLENKSATDQLRVKARSRIENNFSYPEWLQKNIHCYKGVSISNEF